MSFWEGKKVLVTGGTGMVGSQLVELLLAEGAHVRTVVHSRQPHVNGLEAIPGDLTKWESCVVAVKGMDYVFHLAAVVGGINMNITHPAYVYTSNMIMQTQMLEAARQENVERYLYPSSVCVYPADQTLFIENRAWEGPPEPTNAAYGWCKRMGEFQAQAYAKEYGMKIAIVRPANAYGPRDNFDPETSHVIPSLIRKAVERHDPFVVWGKGEVSRDFIHARDVARGMMLALEKYPVADPLNLGAEEEIKIKDLAKLILRLANYEDVKVVLKEDKPIGHLRRRVDTTKAKEKIGFTAEIPLEKGLKETIDWYRNIKLQNKRA